MFTVTYVAGRAEGLAPLDAARRASAFVAERLQERRDETNAVQQP
jgi:hypothetical protein